MAFMNIKNGKINFRCKAENCQHCCCGPFDGISNELYSVDHRPFDEIVLTDDDYRILSEKGYDYLIEEGYSKIAQKQYYKMALEADGTCKAWKEGRCIIHDFSPTLCQAFPFYFDMFSGLCVIECEGFDKDNWIDLKYYKKYIDKARKMYEFWNDFYSEV